MSHNIPKYSELPLGKSDPPLSAWGLYGPHDQLGTLNRLTEDIVLEAAKEIRTGASQSSSQWDGLRHFAYQEERRFYNGATLADFGITDPEGASKTDHARHENTHGVEAFSEKGVVGRGVLLDWASWREKYRPDLEFEPFTGKTKITLDQLQEVARIQGTSIRFGDILFIRSGYLKAYAQTPADVIKPLTTAFPPSFVGVKQSEEIAEWLWSNFAAVAGDQPAFEAFRQYNYPRICRPVH
ncbi:MAG: hypothetical protein Q9162_002952 [Coniocarpon cinnabarinum]